MARKGMSQVPADQLAGMRDETGARLLKFERFKEGKDYKPCDGEELEAIYEMAKYNMLRAKARKRRNGGSHAPRYQTVEELQEAIIQYWEYLQAANAAGIRLIPDVEGLCAYIGITRQTLLTWERDDVNKFSDTVSQVKNDIAAAKKQIGLQGKIPPLVLAMDMNNNHGYTQRQEVVFTPNNPLGDAASEQELLAKYDSYAQLENAEKPGLPEPEK